MSDVLLTLYCDGVPTVFVYAGETEAGRAWLSDHGAASDGRIVTTNIQRGEATYDALVAAGLTLRQEEGAR
jgi:hypothetical protein